MKDANIDAATKQLALEKIAELYTPYHKVVGDFYDSVYGKLPGIGGYSLDGLLAPTN